MVTGDGGTPGRPVYRSPRAPGTTVTAPSPSPGVLFDVDGTLMDTNYLHTLAWWRAFDDADEWAPMNAIHRLVGMGGDQLVRQALGHECPKAVDARSARYRELMDDARPLPGARDLVATAHRHGLAVVLATSSPADELDALLETLDIEPFLRGRTTADDIAETKPSPEVFLTSMERYALDPGRTLAVGDSVWDIRAARDAGVATVAVESGGFSRHELSEAGALAVYRDVGELARQFLTSPLAALVR
jgi:HAD superfamily hydrolase (TIGR01509 family)